MYNAYMILKIMNGVSQQAYWSMCLNFYSLLIAQYLECYFMNVISYFFQQSQLLEQCTDPLMEHLSVLHDFADSLQSIDVDNLNNTKLTLLSIIMENVVIDGCNWVWLYFLHVFFFNFCIA